MMGDKIHGYVIRHLAMFPKIIIGNDRLYSSSKEMEIWDMDRLVGIPDVMFETNKGLYVVEVKSSCSLLGIEKGRTQCEVYKHWVDKYRQDVRDKAKYKIAYVDRDGRENTHPKDVVGLLKIIEGLKK